jgi:hypothetical protein
MGEPLALKDARAVLGAGQRAGLLVGDIALDSICYLITDLVRLDSCVHMAMLHRSGAMLLQNTRKGGTACSDNKKPCT